jgi:predicted nucleic acid-binding protein
MKKLEVYLDTSVPGAFLDPSESPVHKATVEFWKYIIPQYDVYISDLVKIEMGGLRNKRARNYLLDLVEDFGLLPVSRESVDLSKEYLKLLRIPERDALHIAIATIEGMDYLVTWSMKHLARERTRYAVDFVNISRLLKRIHLFTPLDFALEI